MINKKIQKKTAGNGFLHFTNLDRAGNEHENHSLFTDTVIFAQELVDLFRFDISLVKLVDDIVD
jgi:hypothetical protein